MPDLTSAILVAAFAAASVHVLWTLARQGDRTAWPSAEAQVVQVRAEWSPASETGGTVLLARCRFRTADGREVDAWAQGHRGHSARHWVGRWRTAWYDPAHPETFVLDRPRRRSADLAIAAALLVAMGSVVAVLVVAR